MHFSSARDRLYPNTTLGSQSDRWKWHDLSLAQQMKSKALNDRRKDQNRLHSREAIADTDARTSTEGQVCEARQLPR